MPIIEIKGLKGLNFLNLDEETITGLKNEYPDASDVELQSIWQNRLFVKKYGDAALDNMSDEDYYNNKVYDILKSDLVKQTALEEYGTLDESGNYKLPDYLLGLSNNALEQILNEGIRPVTDEKYWEERRKHLIENATPEELLREKELAGEELSEFIGASAATTSLVSAIGAAGAAFLSGFGIGTATTSAVGPAALIGGLVGGLIGTAAWAFKEFNRDEKSPRTLLEELKKSTDRIEEIRSLDALDSANRNQETIDLIKQDIISNSTEYQTDAMFNQLAPLSKYYNAYKDADVMGLLTNEDKADFIATVQGIILGESTNENDIGALMRAITAFDTKMLDWLDKNQTALEHAGVIAHLFGNKFKGTLYQTGQVFIAGEEYLKGLRGYDSEGRRITTIGNNWELAELNLKDYLSGKASPEDSWTNPEYVRKALETGTWNLEKQLQIATNQGISRYSVLTSHEGASIGEMFETAIGESGLIGAQALTGLAFEIGGAAFGSLIRAAGVTKTSRIINSLDKLSVERKALMDSFRSDVNSVAGKLTAINASAMDAYAEGSGTYSTVLLDKMQQIQLDYVNPKVEELINSDRYLTLLQDNISRRYEEWKNQPLKEGQKRIPFNEEQVRVEEEALMKLAAQLEILNSKDYNDRVSAAEDAALAGFYTNGVLKLISSATDNFTIGKFIQGPEVNVAAERNKILASLRLAQDGKFNPIKWTESNWEKLKVLGYGIGKGALSEGLDEWGDSAWNGFGEAVGDVYWNNYQDSINNPDASMTGAKMLEMITQVNIQGIGNLFTKEGFDSFAIGAMMGGNPVNLDIRRGFYEAGQGNYRKALSRAIFSGEGLQNYYNTKDAYNEVSAQITAFNDFVDKHPDILRTYNDALSVIQNRENANASGNVAEIEHSKFLHAVFLAGRLNALMQTDIGRQSESYTKTMGLMNGLIEGSLSENELNTAIDDYINQPENAQLAKDANGRLKALEAMTENAKYLLQVLRDYDEARAEVQSDIKSNKLLLEAESDLIYKRTLLRDIERRISQRESDLGITSTSEDFNSSAEYLTLKAYKNAVDVNARHEQLISNKIDKLNQKVADNSRKIQEILLEPSSEDRTRRLKLLQTETNRDSSTIAMLNKTLNTITELSKRLDKDKELFYNELGDIYSTPKTEILSKEQIMSLNPELRAIMLNAKNKNNYSAAQLRIISELLHDLGTEGLQKIADLSALSDLRAALLTATQELMKNPELYNEYIKHKAFDRRNKNFLYSLQVAEANTLLIMSLVNPSERKIIAPSLSKYMLDKALKLNVISQQEYDEALPISNYREDLSAVLLNSDLSIDAASTVFNAVLTLIATNIAQGKDFTQAFNDVYNAILKLELKDRLSGVLSLMEQLGYQRQATKVTEDIPKREEEKPITAPEEKEEIHATGELFSATGEDLREAKETEEGKGEESVLEEAIEEPSGVEKEPLELEEELLEEPEPVEIPVSSEDTLEQQFDKQAVNSEVLSTEKPDSKDSNVNARGKLNGLFSRKWDSAATRRERGSELIPNVDKLIKPILDWLESKGIDLLSISDYELPLIMADKPDTKLKFVRVNGAKEGNKAVDRTIFLAVDYTPNVKSIHNEKWGKPITVNGKQYLIVGAVSSTREGIHGDAESEAMFDRLLLSRNSVHNVTNRGGKGIFQQRSDEALAKSNEEYYIDDTAYTTMSYFLDGNIITKTETTERGDTSILELLDNPESNPMGLTLDDLRWGLQYKGKMIPINRTGDTEIFGIPRLDKQEDVGAVYLYIPSLFISENSQGLTLRHFVPFRVQPAYYNFGDRSIPKDSPLATAIKENLDKLLSLDYNDRLDAIKSLVQYVVLAADSRELILLDKNRPVITIKTNYGAVSNSFDLSKTEDLIGAREMLNNLSLMININKHTLTDSATLQMYMESGALKTSARILGLPNSRYIVNPIGDNLLPIEQSIPVGQTNRRLLGYNDRILTINNERFRIDSNGNITTYEGNKITDINKLQQIEVAMLILQNDILPSYNANGYDYYVLSRDSENPITAKRRTGTNTFVVATKELSQKLIDMLDRMALKKEQEANAKQAKEEITARRRLNLYEEQSLEDLLSNEDTAFAMAELQRKESLKAPKEVEGSTLNEQESNDAGKNSLKDLQNREKSGTFAARDLFVSEEFGDSMEQLMEEMAESWNLENWEDMSYDEIVEFMKSKGILTEGIDDVQLWIDEIKNCKH